VLGVGLLALLLGTGRLGRRSMAEPAVVPLVLALLAIGSLLASPVQNAISRQIETRADVDALRAAPKPEAFAAMQRQLALRSLADPTPPAWSQFWFGSHPTTLTRIAIARSGRFQDE
jgi:STE24 endopeptidase